MEETCRTPTTLAQRLNQCAEAVGGKRALSLQSGISEPQLYRYLRGEGEPTASKLAMIATLAKVDAGWLLTGEGKQDPAARHKPAYSSDIYLETRKLLDEAWMRIDKPISAENRRLITDIILYERLHQKHTMGEPYAITLNGTISQLLFLMAFDATNLSSYRELMRSVLSQGKIMEEEWPLDRLIPVCNAINRAHVNLFDGPYGVVFYDRMGQSVWPQAAQRLQKLVEEIYAINPQKAYKWLDVGCGNGREMSFLYRNFEHINVYGIEASQACVELCEQQISVGNLPAGRVERADARYFKAQNTLFDVIYSRLTLDQFLYVPYIQGIGILQVMERLHANLKEKGVLSFIVRRGSGMEFSLFQSSFEQENIERIAKKIGFNIIKCECVGDHKTRHDDCLDVILQKK